jgi:signal transduction histidine kinase
VVSSFEARLQECGCKVEIGKLPTIEADSYQMKQLIHHLVGNALKFRRPDVQTVIRIYSDMDSPVNDQDQNEPAESKSVREPIKIYVEDNGIGFDEKYLDRIFQPFQRLHGRLEYGGSGIGLAICRKIVERHNGIITAKSTPGKGAKFIITLPTQQLDPDE